MSFKERYLPKESEDLNRIMIATGVSGCGKDYLLGQMSDQGVLPSDLQVVNFGTELFEQLRNMYPQIRSRDDMRTLLTQAEVRLGVFSLVDRLIATQPAVLNTHVVYRQNESLAMNPDFERRLRPGHYLYVWTDPEQISQWRAMDTSRVRPPESVDEIALHQDIAYEVVSTMAGHFGASFTAVWNRDDNVGQNIGVMQQRIEELQI
jgi:adenylate kinase